MRLPRTLRTASFRLAAVYALLFAASALVLGAVVFWTAREAMLQQLAVRIEAESALLQTAYRSGGLANLVATVHSRGPMALDYLVQTPDGHRMAGDLPAVSARRGWFNLDLSDRQDTGEAQDHDGPEQLRAHASDMGSGVVLVVGDDLRRIDEAEEAILSAFAWAVGATVLLAILGGILLSRAFLHRVDAIVRTAQAIIDGDLARRVPVRGTGDDLDRLASTLNRMLDRTAVLMDSLRQVSSDVAHDLRTPLSRLYQRLEGARAHAHSVPEYEAAVDAAAAEAEGLLDTFSALLRIAQVEGASPRGGFRDVDLSTMVESVADAYRPDAEEAGHRLTAIVAPDLTVRGDQELLTQALANLVENALRHTPVGTRIDIELTCNTSRGILLAVQDDGPGVAAADLPRLTHRFYRGERSRTTPGNGLGLSFVSAIADLHGAKLGVDALKPGLRVSFAFPSTAITQQIAG